jgi:hypothetical protein
MAGDHSLRLLADRIQARAVRRMGELLRQFDGRGDHMKKDGNVLFLTQKQAAERAQISERQRKTAVCVANIPENTFEAAVESEKPATVTKLAEMGRAGRKNKTAAQLDEISDDMLDEISDDMRADNIIEILAELRDGTAAVSPETVAAGVRDSEVHDALADVEPIRVWLDRYVAALLERRTKPEPAPTPSEMVH